MAAQSPSGFGVLLRRHRLAVGLTQEALAEQASLSMRGISDLERGVNLSPRALTVALLASALHLQAGDRAEFAAAARGLWPRLAATEVDDVGPPFVGRVLECAALDRHLSREGPPLLALTGEPGIGKTRLLERAVERGMSRGYAVVRGGCRRKSGQEPYAPLLDALGAAAQALPPARLRAALQGAEWLTRLLPELRFRGKPREQHPPAQEHRLMIASVARFLHNLGGSSGTLLILDDVHWAGSDALNLLDAIVRAAEGTSLRLLIGYRDSELDPHSLLSIYLADFAQRSLIRHLPLGPLAPAEAAALLDRLLGEDDRKARILQRAEGVPFFLVSCAQALTAVGGQDLPWDLTQAIRQRVASLGPDARHLLVPIALAGHAIPLSVLATVVREPAETVSRRLTMACHARLVIGVGEHAFQCAHDVIREVVEAEAGAAERTFVHGRLAEALEGQPAHERRAAELVWHLRAAGEAARALPYTLLAGDHAEEVFAHGEAEEYFRTALALARELGDLGHQGVALERLGKVLRVVGRYEDALATLDEGAALYRQLGDSHGEGRVRAQSGRIYASQGATEHGIAQLHQAVESLAPVEQPSRALAELQAVLAYLLFAGGRYEESLLAAERAAELARAIDDSALLAEAEMRRGTALYLLGRWEGLTVLEQAVPLAESLPDTETLDRLLNNLAAGFSLHGEVEQSRIYAERALDVAEQRGDPVRIGFVLTNVGESLLQLGHWDRARSYLERAATVLHSVGADWYLAYAYLHLGKLSVDEGRWKEAAHSLRECSRLASASHDLTVLATAQNYLAEREILEGSPAAARRRLDAYVTDHADGVDALTWLQPTLAWAHLEEGDCDGAWQIVTAAIPALIEQEQHNWLVPARLIAGMVAARQGRWDEAGEILELVRSQAESMRWPYCKARSLLEQGLLLARRGEKQEAGQKLSAALAMFQQLGAIPYRERTARALSGMGRDRH